MNPATLPLLDGFRAAFRERPGDEVDVAVCVDCLTDEGAALADVLLLFAGTGPTWVAEPWQEQVGWWRVLALWCQRTEPARFSDRFTGTGDDERTLYRFEAIRACYLTEEDVIRAQIQDAFVGNSHCFDRLCRAYKRHILRLFPEVKYERRFALPLERFRGATCAVNALREIEARFAEGSWRVDVGCTITVKDDEGLLVGEQVLAAPDWIPPEPETLYGFPLEYVSREEWERSPRLRRVADEPLRVGDGVVMNERGFARRVRFGELAQGVVLPPTGDGVTGREHAESGEAVLIRSLVHEAWADEVALGQTADISITPPAAE